MIIVSEKLYQYLSDLNQFSFQKRFKVNKKQIFSSKKMKNSGYCIYEYAYSFFGKDF